MKNVLFILLFSLLFIPSLVDAQISVKFNADTTIVCEGYPLQFNDNSTGFNVIKWNWNFGDGSAIDTLQNPLHAYTTAGTYTVTLTASSLYLTDTTTASATKTNYIIVRTVPVPDFSYTDTLFLPSYLFYFNANVSNDDLLPYNYYWNFNQLDYVSGDSIEVYTFPKEGNFQVGLIVEAGAGCVDTIVKTIEVKDVLEGSNIFTPNGDGYNDVFVVKSNGENDFLLEVFNRWGAIVYSQTAKRLQWDGRSSSGVILPPGTYFYHVTSPDVKGYNKSGFVQLVK